MFERFTEKAIKVIMHAQEEARRLGHNFVGTEQILLGLIGEGTGVAAKVLKSLGVNLKDSRIEVEKIIGRGSGFVAVEIPFTPRAKRVLELSLEEARQLGHNYIGTEHLLLGLIREGEGVAARVLENLNIDLTKVRTQVIRMLGETAEVGTGASTTKGNLKTATLDEFGTNLTKLASESKLDPVVGRHSEIDRVVQILGRRTKNNPVLIGEPGVGKTAIAEGLAQRIQTGDIPDILEDKRVLTLDIGLLVAGTKYRGEFEERLKKIMEEIKSVSEINNKGEDSSLKRIGNFIKEARLSKNQSIEELASDLKIGAHQLEAIEEGNEEKLPEKVFIKAMIRRISQKLKLDTEFLMNEFKTERKEVKIEEIVEEVSKKNYKSRQSKNFNPLGFLIIILISGFLGLIASSLIFNLFSDSSQNQTPKQELIKKTK